MTTLLPATAVFDNHPIRRVYDEQAEVWWFSVIDIIQVLTQQPDYQTARKYWNKLKERLGKEGSQVVTDCHQLKMTAPDGKQRLTDVASTRTCKRDLQVRHENDHQLGTSKNRRHSGECRNPALATFRET